MKRILSVFAVLMIIATGCKKMDLVGQYSIETWKALVNHEKIQDVLSDDYYRIPAPDGGSELFALSRDFGAVAPQLYIVIDPSDLIQAGLDPSKLPAENYSWQPESSKLTITFIADIPAIKSDTDIIDLFKSIVDNDRERVGYHEQLDHYGISLGDGNMFEWAKDIAANDKDLVFVLNPEPFIQAGVDTAKLQSWVYGQVQVTEKDGTSRDVYKFLKPYNL